jgi:hypothetical protein
MAAKKNAAAQDLRTPKYRTRIVKNLKKAYLRRPKHPARAADAFSGSSERTIEPCQRHIIGWQAETQPIGSEREGPHEDMRAAQPVEQRGGPLGADQAEEVRTAGPDQSMAGEHRVEIARTDGQPVAHGRRPAGIGQGRRAERQRRS